MTRFLVVGRGFLGRAVAAALGEDARLVPHAAVHEADLLDGVEAALWAGRHPDLGTERWRLEDDPEPVLARRLAARRRPLLTLSTRKVYAPSPRPLAEDAALGPTDRYGRQKLRMEQSLEGLLGPGLTRLRLANIFGFERDASRSTFMTQMLATLARDGEIRFAMSPFVARDFLPIEAAASWIAALVRRPPGGVVNVGSGIALPTGRLALWLIEGFGGGRLVIETPREHDSFVLDTARLRGLLPEAACTHEQLRDAAMALGGRLRAELG